MRDDGRGFEQQGAPLDESHVGLHIMAERAEKIGAALEVFSTPNQGTSVVLTLPADHSPSAMTRQSSVSSIASSEKVIAS